jgi:hypothetical protein
LKLFANVLEAENSIAELSGNLGYAKISRALRMAINDTMRKQRTELRQYVRKTYNIPSKQINSIDFSPASDYNLESKLGGSHKPVQFAYFKPVFIGAGMSVRGSYTKKGGLKSKTGKGRANAPGGVTVEIKKGNPVTIPFAFMVGKFDTPFVFARGGYQKGKGFVTAKPRNPINILSSLSPYGAAFGSKRLLVLTSKAQVDLTKKAKEYLQKFKDEVIK